jgi:hypothetical protein
MQRAAVEARLDIGDRTRDGLAVSQIDFDVILRTGVPRAPVALEGLARAGDDSPAGLGKELDGGVPDPA